MNLINVRNVHKALPEGLRLLAARGVRSPSRAGEVIMMPEPVTTLYRQPCERVIFWEERDANPFFHLFEALWMLGGRDDVAWLEKYNKRMRTFSDDGRHLHGAYGRRWRGHFDLEGGGETDGPDQLPKIIGILTENPMDRRAVLTMWDPTADLGRQGKDVPCNTQVYFSRCAPGNALDMTVTCRSNDVVWGAYGANAVHFSILQEFLAGAIGCEVGRYWQVSNNYHGYVSTLEPVAVLAEQTEDSYRRRPCPYADGLVEPFPLVSVERRVWEEDLAVFLDEGPITGFREPFFRRVVTPMFYAHQAWREDRNYEIALEIIRQCAATDWRLACTEWLQRRRTRGEAA